MSAGATAPRSAWEHAGEVAALIAILLALWQLMHMVAGDIAMTTPWQTIRYTADLLVSADFWPHVETLLR